MAVQMRSPDGEIVDVDERDVSYYQQKGATIVQSSAPSDVTQRGAPRLALAPSPGRSADFRRNLVRGSLEAIPPLASAGAAMLTGGASIPIQLAAAGLGYAGGEGARQTASAALGFNEPPPFSGEALGRISLGGVRGAAEGAGGALLQRAARTGASNLMRQALKASPGVQEAAGANMTATARSMFPEGEALWETAIHERLPIGRLSRTLGSRKGSEMAGEKLDATDQRLQEILAQANRQGWRRTAQDFVGHVSELRSEIIKETNPSQALKALDKMLSEFIAKRRGPRFSGRMGALRRFTPEDVREFNQTWQKEAQTLYSARERGIPVGPRQALRSRFAENVARGAREQLETIPGVAAQNARLQRLQRLREAILDAERRNRYLRWGGPGHVFPVLEWPEFTSRSALWLTDPRSQFALGQIPRATSFALQSMYGSPNSAEEDQNR